MKSSVGVEVDVAVEELHAVVDLVRGHHGIETRPRVDGAAHEGRAAIRVLQVLDVDLRRIDPRLVERLQKEEVGVGADGHRDGLAAQVVDRVDAAAGQRREGRPLGLRVDVDDLDGRTVGARQERRGARGRAHVEGARTEPLVRLVRAERLGPRDCHVVAEGLLEPALVLDDEAQRVVGREVDVEGRGAPRAAVARRLRVGVLAGASGERERGDGGRGGGRGEDALLHGVSLLWGGNADAAVSRPRACRRHVARAGP